MSSGGDEKQVIYHNAQINDFSVWAIGRGWEGTASDWTDYFFVMMGFLSLIFWLNQRNPNYIDEEALLDRVQGMTDENGEEEGAEAQGDPPEDNSTEVGTELGDGGVSSQSTGFGSRPLPDAGGEAEGGARRMR